MEHGPLSSEIIKAFDALPAQLRTAARFVLDRPTDVALLSMREQARQAGVQPATMTRLAKHFGLSGYDELRARYASAVRDGDVGFAAKAGEQAAAQRLKGDQALAADIVASVGAQIAQLAAPDQLARLAAAAKLLAKARRIYCLGLRSSHPVAWHLAYTLGLIGARAVHLDGAGWVGADALAGARKRDALFVVSVRPYTRLTVAIAEHAASMGVPVVAVTDSEVAPLASIAERCVFVPTGSPSFLHTMSSAFVVAEILAALIAGRRGDEALDGLRRSEAHLAALGAHLGSDKPKPGR